MSSGPAWRGPKRATVARIGRNDQGNIETTTDADWYRLRLAGARQVHFTWTWGNDCVSTEDTFQVRDRLGRTVHIESPTFGWDPDWGEESGSWSYTTPPGGDLYYLTFQSDQEGSDCHYRFAVNPPSAVVTREPAAPPRVALPEPDDGPRQANRGVTGDLLYTGTIDTSNDEDWMTFRVRPGRAVRVQLRGIGSDSDEGPCSYLGGAAMIDRPDDNTDGEYLDPGNNQAEEIVTSTGGGGQRRLSRDTGAGELRSSRPALFGTGE